MIDEQVAVQLQRLESRLLDDVRDAGMRTVARGARSIGEQLGGRIETLERVARIQTRAVTGLRDASRSADERVGTVVENIERSLSQAVPGFRLEQPARHTAFGLEPACTLLFGAEETAECIRAEGYCPKCTSGNIRRARRRGVFDLLVRAMLLAPFRCRACRHKFYRF